MLKIVPSRFATSIDTDGVNCSSLVGNVLNYHLSVMKDDGFIDDDWNRILQKLGIIPATEDLSNPMMACEAPILVSKDLVQKIWREFLCGTWFSLLLLLAWLEEVSWTSHLRPCVQRKNTSIDSAKKNDDIHGIGSETEVRQSSAEIPQSWDDINVSTDNWSLQQVRRTSLVGSQDIKISAEKLSRLCKQGWYHLSSHPKNNLREMITFPHTQIAGILAVPSILEMWMRNLR